MYLDNKQLHLAMVDFLQKVEQDPETRIPEYIGECIYLINVNLAKRANFTNYSFKDDMIDTGIELCLRYIKNYDYVKYSNPHTFFTQYAWRGFVNVINSEELQSYFKAKLSVSPDEMHSSLQEIDEDMRPEEDALATPYFNISEFETRFFKKKKEESSDSLTGLEEFIEELILEEENESKGN